MASREQFGYWRATFTNRIPRAAALCGARLLTVKLPQIQTKNLDVSEDSSAVREATTFCLELDHVSTPEQALELVRAQSLACLTTALKASFDAAETPSIPAKVAVTLYGKLAEAQTPSRKDAKLWADTIKTLKKVPQETMVNIMFLLSISQKLSSRNVTIDGHEPEIWLLRGMWPASLALSEDAYAGDKLSTLLATNYDQIPTDMPLILQAVNYRFGSGNRFNLLSLMKPRRGDPNPAEVQEIHLASAKS
jgi:hypothetical protein